MPDSIIWKYELQPGITTLRLPIGSQALTVHAQGPGGIFLWARVNTSAPKEDRAFYTLGTGHDPEVALGPYIGTAFLGPLVFHTFEVLP